MGQPSESAQLSWGDSVARWLDTRNQSFYRTQPLNPRWASHRKPSEVQSADASSHPGRCMGGARNGGEIGTGSFVAVQVGPVT